MTKAIDFRPVHPFPARMAPSIALSELPIAGKKRLTVLDPMAGSGTAVLAARSRGHRAVGLDTDPLALLITEVSCADIDAAAVLAAAKTVLNRAKQAYSEIRLGEAYPSGADEETKAFVRYWFDGINRRQLKSLADSISAVRKYAVRRVLWCAFSRLIIAKARGASLAMDLSHSRPHKVASRNTFRPLNEFFAAVRTILERAPFSQGETSAPGAVVRAADARAMPLADDSVDVVITSPPYLNAIDYLRCHKFSLIWMGHSIGGLRQLRNTNVGSEAARGADPDSDAISQAVASAGNVKKLPVREQRMLARYALDVNQVMEEISRVLVPRGRAVLVIGDCTMRGVFIRNSKLIEALGAQHGLTRTGSKSRALPANRRYLPPPASHRGAPLDGRMRREIVLTLTKRRAA